MKRKLRLRGWNHLAAMHKKATGRALLPEAFSLGIHRIASAGIHPEIFKGAEHVRKITFCPAMAETGFKGAYQGQFGGRQEFEFPEDKIDWFKYGWDGGTTCMIYPTDNPEVWVVVHEFGHYIDDIYLCKDFHHFRLIGCDREKIKRFIFLRAGMKLEFEEAHKAALESVSEERRKSRSWFNYISTEIWLKHAPTLYSFFNYTEWIAECFQIYYLRGGDFLASRCPRTFEFLDYALRGEVFFRKEAKPTYDWQAQWMEEDLSYAAVSALKYGEKIECRPK